MPDREITGRTVRLPVCVVIRTTMGQDISTRICLHRSDRKTDPCLRAPDPSTSSNPCSVYSTPDRHPSETAQHYPHTVSPVLPCPSTDARSSRPTMRHSLLPPWRACRAGLGSSWTAGDLLGLGAWDGSRGVLPMGGRDGWCDAAERCRCGTFVTWRSWRRRMASGPNAGTPSSHPDEFKETGLARLTNSRRCIRPA